MKKSIILLVDLEDQYLIDDNVFELLDKDDLEIAKHTIKNEYKRIANEIKLLKDDGWEIHFTGETMPNEYFVSMIDKIHPYWATNTYAFGNYFRNQRVYIGGIFLERCVLKVSQIISKSMIIPHLTISHTLIGDNSLY